MAGLSGTMTTEYASKPRRTATTRDATPGPFSFQPDDLPLRRHFSTLAGVAPHLSPHVVQFITKRSSDEQIGTHSLNAAAASSYTQFTNRDNFIRRFPCTDPSS